MNRWIGKVAVVTGASSGIGAAITKDLVKSGLIVVGLARRKNRIEALMTEIPSTPENGKLYAIECDLTKDDNIVNVFNWIEENLGRIDVLVNNAAYMKHISVLEANNEDVLKQTIQTNLWGLILCTKKCFEIMKRKNVNDGHIININSVVGHKVSSFPGTPPLLNVYPSTKFGVTALTEVLRQEFIHAGTKTKISSISPGAVDTEIIDKSEFDVEAFKNFPMLQPEDISSAVLYVLGTQPNVQIHELTIKPVGESF